MADARDAAKKKKASEKKASKPGKTAPKVIAESKAAPKKK
jgi:hypothetical protein